MYALFTIMPLRDSIIYINVVLVVCKDAGQHPDNLARTKMRPKNELLELIRRNNIEGYNLYMESGNEALFRELALNEEFFACGMKKYESALIDYGVSHDNTLLKRVATDICMSLGYPDDVSISHISGIIEDNHMDNYYHSEA